MPRQGEELQRLVRALERATHDNQSVSVESPKFLPDRDTGQQREHDVVVTFTLQHHTVRLALECRDRSRKVGVPEIEAFYAKCHATGIDRGIIVSSAGFYKRAVSKAAKCNIGCLALSEVDGFDWCLAPGIETMERRLVHAQFHVDPEPGTDVGGGWQLIRGDGSVVDNEGLKNLGLHCLNSLEPSQATDQPIMRRFSLVGEAFALINEQGQKIPVRTVTCDVTYEVICGFIPFDFRQYIDIGKQRQLYSAAIAAVDLGGFRGEVIVIRDEEREESRVVLVPNRNL